MDRWYHLELKCLLHGTRSQFPGCLTISVSPLHGASHSLTLFPSLLSFTSLSLHVLSVCHGRCVPCQWAICVRVPLALPFHFLCLCVCVCVPACLPVCTRACLSRPGAMASSAGSQAVMTEHQQLTLDTEAFCPAKPLTLALASVLILPYRLGTSTSSPPSNLTHGPHTLIC